jgi:hypothetical protein
LGIRELQTSQLLYNSLIYTPSIINQLSLTRNMEKRTGRNIIGIHVIKPERCRMAGDKLMD